MLSALPDHLPFFLDFHNSPLSHLVRSQDPGQRRVLDRAARQRRINRQLEALENDNFQDDPHAGLPQLGKRLPQFDDDADTGVVEVVGERMRWCREVPGSLLPLMPWSRDGN